MSMLLPILFPVLAGFVILILPAGKDGNGNTIFGKRVYLISLAIALQFFSSILTTIAIWRVKSEYIWFEFATNLPVYFKIDRMGVYFAWVITICWTLAMIFSCEYMKHEDNNRRFYGFFLMEYGVMIGCTMAGNLITYYAFFELVTLLSMPFVLHSLSREAIMAALKYTFFSFTGAYMVLFGIFFLFHYTNTLSFTPGGTLDHTLIVGHHGLLLLCALLMILGFSVKAGMFPMHAWLPSAHPVAPAPASAVLSGLIVKIGILGIIRVVYYIYGMEFLHGTFVQKTWMILSLITVFMGSMLAYREDVIKKRLAYSTVSQLSYILFGLSLMEESAVNGALLHVLFHAYIKTGLFLTVGAIIYKTGKTKVSELTGIGKQMPIAIWSFTILSLGLIGIPPTGGFLSKWYLAIGALHSEIPVFSILGPVVLLISALLTAGYLLPVTVKGFFPGEDFDFTALEPLEKKKSMLWLLIPIVILAALTLVQGAFPADVLKHISQIVDTLF